MIRHSSSILLCFQLTAATAALGAGSPPPIRCRSSADCLAVAGAGAKCAFSGKDAEWGVCEAASSTASSSSADATPSRSSTVTAIYLNDGWRKLSLEERQKNAPNLSWEQVDSLPASEMLPEEIARWGELSGRRSRRREALQRRGEGARTDQVQDLGVTRKAVVKTLTDIGFKQDRKPFNGNKDKTVSWTYAGPDGQMLFISTAPKTDRIVNMNLMAKQPADEHEVGELLVLISRLMAPATTEWTPDERGDWLKRAAASVSRTGKVYETDERNRHLSFGGGFGMITFGISTIR
jgi:hypothetical protein